MGECFLVVQTLNYGKPISLHYIAVGCNQLNNPMDGYVQLSGTTFMNNATYSCKEGYELNGDNVRVCNASGRWVPDEPTCERTCRSYTQLVNVI